MERDKKRRKMNLEFEERRSSKPKLKKIPKRMAYDPDEFESFEEMMDHRYEEDDDDYDEDDDTFDEDFIE